MRRAAGKVAAVMLLSLLFVIPTACTSSGAPSPPELQNPTEQSSPGLQSTSGTEQSRPGEVAGSTPAPHRQAPWWGLTVDTIDKLDATVTAVAAMPVAPVVRLVFDLDQAPESYLDAVTRLSEHAEVMALVVDSSGFAQITGEQYLDRFRTYVALFGNRIDLWEIGNEVNGEWLGDPAKVVRAITGADQIVRARGLTPVLTLYYNPQCSEDAAHDMLTWAGQELTEGFRESLPYLLLSYYPDQCRNYWPDAASWQQTFDSVGTLFPRAMVGMGEIGTSDDSGSIARKVDLLNRCYGLHIEGQRYIGGCFWWYFVEDAVPNVGNPIWDALVHNMSADG